MGKPFLSRIFEVESNRSDVFFLQTFDRVMARKYTKLVNIRANSRKVHFDNWVAECQLLFWYFQCWFTGDHFLRSIFHLSIRCSIYRTWLFQEIVCLERMRSSIESYSIIYFSFYLLKHIKPVKYFESIKYLLNNGMEFVAFTYFTLSSHSYSSLHNSFRFNLLIFVILFNWINSLYPETDSRTVFCVT